METFSALLALCAGNSPVTALMFSLICAWINGWVNSREAGDLKHHHVHYDVTLMVWYLRVLVYRHDHDDVIKWKHFPRYWPFVRGIHQSPVNYPHKGQWRRALMFSLICTRINGWVNNGEAGDLRRYRGHYDANVMCQWRKIYYLQPIYLNRPRLEQKSSPVCKRHLKWIFQTKKVLSWFKFRWSLGPKFPFCDKSALVKFTVWCRQATSHYLN